MKGRAADESMRIRDQGIKYEQIQSAKDGEVAEGML